MSILSVPIALPGEEPLAVLYLAERCRTDFGTVLAERLQPLVTSLAHELHVEAEVERRTAALREAAPEPHPDLPAGLPPVVRAELSDLMAGTTDPHVRDRLARLLGPAAPDAGRDGGSAGLTPREVDVVRCATDGCLNADIAARLGLREGTVKSYMKSAMAKLGATNRVQAGLQARRLGLF